MIKEIVFGPSVQGSLAMAQFTGIGSCPASMLLDVDSEDKKVANHIQRLNEEIVEKWNNSRPIGGKKEDILCLEYSLEYGDISESIPGKKRYDSIHHMIRTMYKEDLHGDLANTWVANIKKANNKALKSLKASMEKNESIRIWYSSSPSEINAFYWLMSFFDKNKHYSNISTVYLPPDYWNGKSYCTAWGHISPEIWHKTLNLDKTIGEEQIKFCAQKWKELKHENLPLRLMISGNLVSLHETFLDAFIEDTLKQLPDSFTIAQLVGNIMGNYGLMLGDMPIFERVNEFINRGELILTEDWKESPMQTRIRKNN